MKLNLQKINTLCNKYDVLIKEVNKQCESKLFNLYKCAKLTDEQYKQMYFALNRNYELKEKLIDDNLLDEFYKSMPTLSDKDIDLYLSRSEFKTKKLNEFEKGKIKIFLDMYGSEKLNIDNELYLSEDFDKRIVSPDTTLISAIEKYNHKPIKDLILSYIKTPNIDSSILDKFINFYPTYQNSVKRSVKSDLSKAEKYSLSLEMNRYRIILAKIIVIIINAMVAAEETTDLYKEKYETAKKIRETDIFDELYQKYIPLPSFDLPKTQPVQNPTLVGRDPSQGLGVSGPEDLTLAIA